MIWQEHLGSSPNPTGQQHSALKQQSTPFGTHDFAALLLSTLSGDE
jgi:hypothetical protein